MSQDAALPRRTPRPASAVRECHGITFTSARWSADHLARLVSDLREHGRPSLAAISDDELLASWCNTVEAFLDPCSDERREVEIPLRRFCGLSAAGTQAALEVVLGGVDREPAEALLRQAEPYRSEETARPLVAVFLAANLPALAVQTLLPALLLRRPILVKSASSEPLFTAAFVSALARRLPPIADAVAAVTWAGGSRDLENPVLQMASRVLAYGEESTLVDLEKRAPGKIFRYGPKVSLAVVDAESDFAAASEGLARDIALFDQRGCLSVQAVYTDGDARRLARELVAALQQIATRLQPGPVDPIVAAAVQQIRTEAALRGLYSPPLALTSGTVVVESRPELLPSPGLRCVRVHRLQNLRELPHHLVSMDGRIQGVALTGSFSHSLIPALRRLGVSRFSRPGELQFPDATWHNGGVHPFAALCASSLVGNLRSSDSGSADC